MSRRLALGFVCFASVAICLSADEPKKPQWQRLLTGEDAKKAADLLLKANALAAKDDYAGAIKAAEELLALRTKVQGEDHHETVSAKYDLLAYRKIGELPAEKRQGWRKAEAENAEAYRLEDKTRYGDALPKRQARLKWCQETLGEHPYTASSYNNIAHILNAQARYAEAQPLLQKALDIRRRVLGDKHPDTALSYNNLALNLNAQGK